MGFRFGDASAMLDSATFVSLISISVSWQLIIPY